MDIGKRMEAVERMIPKTGFNIVGVDTFEEPGAELFLIGHYETRDEADKAMAEAKAKDPDLVAYVYAAE